MAAGQSGKGDGARPGAAVLKDATVIHQGGETG